MHNETYIRLIYAYEEEITRHLETNYKKLTLAGKLQIYFIAFTMFIDRFKNTGYFEHKQNQIKLAAFTSYIIENGIVKFKDYKKKYLANSKDIENVDLHLEEFFILNDSELNIIFLKGLQYFSYVMDKPKFYDTLYLNLYIHPFIGAEYQTTILDNNKLKEYYLLLLTRKNYDTNKFREIIIGVNKLMDNHFERLSNNYFWKNSIAMGIPKKQENCYIATLAYGDINHPKVELFRNYRDNKLVKNSFGKLFIKIYYNISPSVVTHLKNKTKINKIIKIALDYFLLIINKK